MEMCPLLIFTFKNREINSNCSTEIEKGIANLFHFIFKKCSILYQNTLSIYTHMIEATDLRFGFETWIFFLVNFGLKCLDSSYFQNWRLKFCQKFVFFSPLSNWFIKCRANYTLFLPKQSLEQFILFPFLISV